MYIAVWSGALLVLCSGGRKSPVELSAYILLSAFLVIFCATRYETGYDWPAYQKFYQQLYEPTGTYQFEFGFVLMAKLTQGLGLDFWWFQALAGGLQVSLIAFFIRKLFGGLSLLGLAVYYTVPDLYLIHSFSLMRQGLALAFFLCGAVYLIERRLLLSSLLMIAAVSFHTSSLLAIAALLLVWRVRVNYQIAVVSVVCGAVAYLAGLDTVRIILNLLVQIPFFEKYAIYSRFDTPSASAIYKLLFVSVFLFLFAIVCYRRHYLKRLELYSENDSILFGLSFVAVFVSFYLWSLPTLQSRYQAFFILFLIYNAMLAVKRTLPVNRFFLYLAVLMLSSSFYAKFFLTSITMVYFPYQSIFTDGIEHRSTGAERTDKLYSELRRLWKGAGK